MSVIGVILSALAVGGMALFAIAAMIANLGKDMRDQDIDREVEKWIHVQQEKNSGKSGESGT
jgi:hypothetical protein